MTCFFFYYHTTNLLNAARNLRSKLIVERPRSIFFTVEFEVQKNAGLSAFQLQKTVEKWHNMI